MTLDQKLLPLPEDWQRALAVAAHPDDLEYGAASAIARWTDQGKEVAYLLVTSGEAGISSMHPDKVGPLREEEERRSAAAVGVHTVDFLHHKDGVIEYGPASPTRHRPRHPQTPTRSHPRPQLPPHLGRPQLQLRRPPRRCPRHPRRLPGRRQSLDLPRTHRRRSPTLERRQNGLHRQAPPSPPTPSTSPTPSKKASPPSKSTASTSKTSPSRSTPTPCSAATPNPSANNSASHSPSPSRSSPSNQSAPDPTSACRNHRHPLQ